MASDHFCNKRIVPLSGYGRGVREHVDTGIEGNFQARDIGRMGEYQMIVLVRDGNGRGGDILRHQFYFRAAEKRTGEKFGDLCSAIDLRLNDLNRGFRRGRLRKKRLDGVGNIKRRAVGRVKAAARSEDAWARDFARFDSFSDGNGVWKIRA